jgi:hypothetical protein
VQLSLGDGFKISKTFRSRKQFENSQALDAITGPDMPINSKKNVCSILGKFSADDPGLGHRLVCRIVLERSDYSSLVFEAGVNGGGDP